MAGLAYAHANHGTIMSGGDGAVAALQDTVVAEFVEKVWGEVVVPKCSPEGVLSEDEVRFVDEVTGFINTFETS